MGWFDDNAYGSRTAGRTATQPTAPAPTAPTAEPTGTAPMWTGDAIPGHPVTPEMQLAAKARMEGPAAFGNDYRKWFMALVGNRPANSDMLKGLGDVFAKFNIKLRPNAAGSYGKIELPTGQVIDVGQAFSSGDPSRMKWQWLTGDGGSGGAAGGGSLNGLASGSATAPFTGKFSAPKVTDDPGFQWRLQQGQQALERSAASRGTLLTGGTLKDLAAYSQGLASQEYGAAYNRKRSEFDLGRDIFESNQDRPWEKLSSLAQLGKPT